MTKIKICGIKTPEAMEAAIYGGADFVGLVFHPPSPRHVEIEVAAYLARYVPATTAVVGLFVNPTDDLLTQTLTNVRIDMIQLHGDETPQRVKSISDTYQKPIIKSFSVAAQKDLSEISRFEDVADWYLLDSGSGGTGKPFDWSLLDGFKPQKPWMLAGGLNDQNVGDAITRLKPHAVDVSSGVESVRGVKSPDKITTFMTAVKNA